MEVPPLSLGSPETHQNHLFGFFWAVIIIFFSFFFFLNGADWSRGEGAAGPGMRAGWQEPPQREHVSAVPGRGEQGFHKFEWEMAEPEGEVFACEIDE